MIFRLSVRAFTKLFDEDHEEFLSPLFTDTFLSKPFVTDAGITHARPCWGRSVGRVLILHVCVCSEPLSGVIEGVSAGLFLIASMVGLIVLLICRQKVHKLWVWLYPSLLKLKYSKCSWSSHQLWREADDDGVVQQWSVCGIRFSLHNYCDQKNSEWQCYRKNLSNFNFMSWFLFFLQWMMHL